MVFKTDLDMKTLRPGTKLWACAYEFDNNKTTMGLKQKPVHGVVTDTWFSCEDDGINPARYFIPFKKDGESLCKSKAVRIGSRKYAETYDECVDLYNELVQEKIDWFGERINKVKEDFI